MWAQVGAGSVILYFHYLWSHLYYYYLLKRTRHAGTTHAYKIVHAGTAEIIILSNKTIEINYFQSDNGELYYYIILSL